MKKAFLAFTMVPIGLYAHPGHGEGSSESTWSLWHYITTTEHALLFFCVLLVAVIVIGRMIISKSKQDA